MTRYMLWSMTCPFSFTFRRPLTAVAANHPAYLSWMLSKDFPRSTRLVARRLLEEQDQAHYSAEGEHESAPEAAEVGENEPPF